MKKYISIVLTLLVFVSVSCNKDEKISAQSEPKEIVLNVGEDEDIKFVTKTSVVDAVPSSLYWGASTGSAVKYASTTGTVSGGKIATGKFQTATPTPYVWYTSNVGMSIAANATVSASNTTDVICGKSAATTSITPSVAMNHIFARTGSLTLSLPSGYTHSSVTWTIKPKSGETNTGTAGTYNITSGAWSSTTALTNTNITGSSDLYLIPGNYTLTVSFTASKGDFSKTYTQSGTVTLTGGKINNITATSSTNEAQGITISVSLTAWSSQSTSVTLS